MKKVIGYIWLIFTIGCGEVVPQPKEYDGWERLVVKQLSWPKDCNLPPRHLFISDTAHLNSYQCNIELPDADFSKWDFVLYNEGWYYQITDMTVADFVYISHEQKKVEIVPATRYTKNTSGLTSVGYDAMARHFFLMPKVPKGYTVELGD